MEESSAESTDQGCKIRDGTQVWASAQVLLDELGIQQRELWVL